MPLNVIAIEEHFWTPELRELRTAAINRSGAHLERLDDLGAFRLREMDEAGIDMQVLSETAPAAQAFEPDQAIRLARSSNDFLHAAIRAHPDRFAGFAALPTPDPKAAADELERAVTKLGFKGAMIMGLSRGERFLDDKPFWPIFERAQALDVPIYLHPSTPHSAVNEVYYKGFPGPRGSGARLRQRGRDAGGAAGGGRRARRLPEAQDHPRPSRRGAAVPAVAHRPLAHTRRQAAANASPTTCASISGSRPAAPSRTPR